MDDSDFVQEETAMTVGQRLRAAREAAGMTLEEVATTTRIPTRHLESLENSDFQRLPAPTYTIGFAKNYAQAVGLDRREIADQLRGEVGGLRPASYQLDTFEPADPARAFPKWLLFAVIAGIVIVIAGFSWLRSREYSEDAPVTTEETAASTSAPTQAAAAAAPAPAAAQGPVLLTANEEVWLQVKDGGTTLKEGILQAGQSFEVPASATAPVLTTGKPEALRISVGTADAPPVGPAATTVSNVSLLAKDLMAARPTTGQVPPAIGTPPAR
ncbi:helix-turn-helix domain-containing protein [Sphingomonas sp. HDW15A]|uniref:helix-turn-helix domain-containing protein n=1 Tax=Sphingomonas sp. HDW15A TaxID=2714942 RepID=UPI0014095343|nr:RodZ domain-containing protein [Sphingomonas sp. HDW15A]QIK96677.1 helix-turn-helix domain-containing protein [Sphingomonas sp. HDW15A]